MKKLIVFLIAIVMLSAVSIISAAAYYTVSGVYEEPAVKDEEIIAEEAGETSTVWVVPYLPVKPTLDGTINNNEYGRFKDYQDYLYYIADINDCTEEEFEEFVDNASAGFFDVYWGWDGEYLYMAFSIECINGYYCNPKEAYGNDVYLFASNCIQFGIAASDGYDKANAELGFGVNSSDGTPITYTWNGSYTSQPDDFAGRYDEVSNTLIYEFRVHLQKSLGLVDTTIKNDDTANICFVIQTNDKGRNEYKKSVSFCHGITGQYSNKKCEYFANVIFSGLPDGTVVVPVEVEQASDEEKEYDICESVNMGSQDVLNTFSLDGFKAEIVTEGDTSFTRLTATADNGYIYSDTYPRNLLQVTHYVVIKYRTSSTKASDLGYIYKSPLLTDYDFDLAPYETVNANGCWNYMYLDMTSEANWFQFIMNAGIIPFYDVEGASGEVMDIAWMKYFNEDPYGLYEDETPADDTTGSDVTDGDDVTTAEVPGGVTTEADDATTANTPVTTAEVLTTDASTDNQNVTTDANNPGVTTDTDAASDASTTEGSSSSGCGGIAGAGILALISVICGACVIRRRKD